MSDSTVPSAYVHVPFCRHRCGYCNFTLVAGRDDLIESYLKALAVELAWLGEPRSVDTLFLGGGTPSHLPPAQLRTLTELVTRWFIVGDGGEFSLEANPADVNASRLEVLAQAGLTRLSLGAQSFHSPKLQTLERDHDGELVRSAAGLARDHGLSLAVDLIFGVPGESLDVWQSDLQQALKLEPDHVSTYGLTFEQGTSFWSRHRRGELGPVEEDLERSMYLWAIDQLTSAGYEHYEVSNFARPGKRCRHNEVYWTGGSFYAAGPGAARYLDGRRAVNHRSTSTYLRRVLSGQSPVAEVECLTPAERAREQLVFGLRRLEGVDMSQWARRYQVASEERPDAAIERMVAAGFLERDGSLLRLTRPGLLISDSLWPDLL